MAKKIFQELVKELDKPANLGYSFSSYFGPRIIITVFFEDGNAQEYHARLEQNYKVTINKKDYFLISDAIYFKNKLPHIDYFYNNPFPIKYDYQPSQVTAWDLRSEEEQKIIPDKKKIYAFRNSYKQRYCPPGL